jgi:AraC-like DNA-binding protein
MMYILNIMADLHDVAGVWFHTSRRRIDYRSYFFSRKMRGDNINLTLFLIDQGFAYFRFPDTLVTAGPGDIVCWDRGKLEESGVVPGHSLSYHAVGFDILSREPGKPGLADIGFPYLIRLRDPGPVRALLDEIHAILGGRGAFRQQECSALGMRLLLAIQKNRAFGKYPLPEEAAGIDRRISEQLTYINRNYKKRMTVPMLANRALMHPVHFARLFRKQTGFPPYRYILEMKISKAKDFLINFGAGKVYLSTELGFRDYSHFYRVFRKVAGQTPAQFLKAHGSTRPQKPPRSIAGGANPSPSRHAGP